MASLDIIQMIRDLANRLQSEAFDILDDIPRLENFQDEIETEFLNSELDVSIDNPDDQTKLIEKDQINQVKNSQNLLESTIRELLNLPDQEMQDLQDQIDAINSDLDAMWVKISLIWSLIFQIGKPPEYFTELYDTPEYYKVVDPYNYDPYDPYSGDPYDPYDPYNPNPAFFDGLNVGKLLVVNREETGVIFSDAQDVSLNCLVQEYGLRRVCAIEDPNLVRVINNKLPVQWDDRDYFLQEIHTYLHDEIPKQYENCRSYNSVLRFLYWTQRDTIVCWHTFSREVFVLNKATGLFDVLFLLPERTIDNDRIGLSGDQVTGSRSSIIDLVWWDDRWWCTTGYQSDSVGEIFYSLDAEGTQWKRLYFSSLGTLHDTRTQLFVKFDRIYMHVNAFGLSPRIIELKKSGENYQLRHARTQPRFCVQALISTDKNLYTLETSPGFAASFQEQLMYEFDGINFNLEFVSATIINNNYVSELSMYASDVDTYPFGLFTNYPNGDFTGKTINDRWVILGFQSPAKQFGVDNPYPGGPEYDTTKPWLGVLDQDNNIIRWIPEVKWSTWNDSDAGNHKSPYTINDINRSDYGAFQHKIWNNKVYALVYGSQSIQIAYFEITDDFEKYMIDPEDLSLWSDHDYETLQLTTFNENITSTSADYRFSDFYIFGGNVYWGIFMEYLDPRQNWIYPNTYGYRKPQIKIIPILDLDYQYEDVTQFDVLDKNIIHEGDMYITGNMLVDGTLEGSALTEDHYHLGLPQYREYTAAENIVPGRAVILIDDPIYGESVKYADSGFRAHSRYTLGISIENALAGETLLIMVAGEFDPDDPYSEISDPYGDINWNFEEEKAIWLLSNGELTQDFPAQDDPYSYTSFFAIKLGHAISNRKMMVRIEDPILFEPGKKLFGEIQTQSSITGILKKDKYLKGEINSQSSLTAAMENPEVLSGEIEGISSIDGNINKESKINGNISSSSSTSGDLTVT